MAARFRPDESAPPPHREELKNMKRRENGLILTTVMAMIIAVAAPGCASKKYVSQQINQVRQQNAQYQKDTNSKIAWLNNREQANQASMAQMNNHMAVTDQKIADVNDRMVATDQKLAEAIETNRGMAARAAEEANSIGMNYQLTDKAAVLFAFNKATLTPAAKAALDTVADRVRQNPRAVVELAGFTDHVGSTNYNLELSRRRA